jgi:hypothetical protein
VNKRKAMIGWVVYTAAKPIVKRALKSKAKAAVPAKRAGAGGPNKAALLAGAGAVVTAVVFWRRGTGGDSEASES